MQTCLRLDRQAFAIQGLDGLKVLAVDYFFFGGGGGGGFDGGRGGLPLSFAGMELRMVVLCLQNGAGFTPALFV